MWLRIAFREVAKAQKFGVLFVVSLTLGMLGLLVLNSFQSSLKKSLSENSRALLGGDLKISGRRSLSESEWQSIRKILPDPVEQISNLSMFSMVRLESGDSKLVRLNAVGEDYPLYGQLELKLGGKVTSSLGVQGENIAWIDQELQAQLGIAIGQKVWIGKKEFEVADCIVFDSTASIGFSSLAPKVYISRPSLSGTGLVQKGSNILRSHYFKFSTNVDLEAVQRQLNAVLVDPEIRVRTHKNSASQTTRILDYLGDYLGLVSLVALFLGSIGTGFLFRSYVTSKMRDIAIFSALGMMPASAVSVFVAQIVILGAIAATIASAISATTIPALGTVASELLPSAFLTDLSLPIESVLLAFMLGTLGSLFVCLPTFRVVAEVKPILLFSQYKQQEVRSSLKGILLFGPLFCFYWILSVWQANSLIIGTGFFVGLISAAVLIYFTGMAIVIGLERLHSRISKILVIQLGLRIMVREKAHSVWVLLALSLSVMLINFIAQIQAGIIHELNPVQKESRPSLFLIDIQEDQLGELKSGIREMSSNLSYVSPIIRARLLKINTMEFKKQERSSYESREQEWSRRSRNRGFNLSWREGLASSETIVEGLPLPSFKLEDEVPLVSVEMRFAQRLDLKIGDLLEFDIQGIPVYGKIHNLRRVNWSSFHPNFFIQFQPGVLDDAPKTYIATIDDLQSVRKAEIQSAIASGFPNISMIDVSALIIRFEQIIRQTTFILQLMAILTFIVGLSVLFSLVRYQSQMRRYTFSLFKVLGLNFRDIVKIHMIESLAIGIVSSVLGILASVFFGRMLSLFSRDEDFWAFSWEYAFVSVASVSILCILTAFSATMKTLNEKPIYLLKSQPS